MQAKSVVGLLAILVAIWIWSTLNLQAFERDAYSLCLGRVGQGPTVTEDERIACACAVRDLLADEPLRARLPDAISHIPPSSLIQVLRPGKQCRIAK